MINKHENIFKSRKRKNRGFTLVEMMLSVLIMLLFTTITASVMKTAILAYEKSIDCANGEMFVSNAISRLRIELTDARNLEKVINQDYTATKGNVYGLDGCKITCGVYYTDARTGAECLVFYGSDADDHANIYVSKYGALNPLVYTTDSLSLIFDDITIKETNVVFSSIAAVDRNNTVYSTVNEMTFVLQ